MRRKLPPGFDLQGHRGCRGLMPENTVSGFLHALSLGVQTLELDVVISQDDQVVVSHEPWLNAEICLGADGQQLTPAEGRAFNLRLMEYAEIKLHDCGALGHPRFPLQKAMPACKPLLAEVIQAADAWCAAVRRPLPRYNIELKLESGSSPWEFNPPHPDFALLVVEVVELLGALPRCNLQSFDLEMLRVLHHRHPLVRLALLDETGKGLPLLLEEIGFVPHTYSPLFHLLDDEVVRSAHALSMKVVPWTVNAPDDMLRMLNLGVDGLITDRPDLFLGIVHL